MFVGLAFILISSVFPLTVWAIYGIVRLVKGPEPAPAKSLAPMQKAKFKRAQQVKKERIFRRWKLGFSIFLPLWLAFYAWNIFPEIPSGFGGAKPYAARLIGTEESIQKINDQIAFEAGVPTEKLPFETLPGTSGLTTGANVLILDKSDARIFLLLTRDLYLSSTSNFAKKMIDLGEIPEDLETGDAHKFQVKPLIVNADGIDGITLSLFQPPEVTTKEDLQLAAEIVAADPDAAKAVTDVISSELPGVGEQIVAAVKRHQEENPVVNKPSKTTNTPVVVVPEISLEDVINDVIEESVDTTFLDFRALAFSQAGNLIAAEKRNGADDARRRQLIQTVTKNFEEDFPESWADLDPIKNFLVVGQDDARFPHKIQSAFRGAETPDMVMTRLNTTEKEVENTFPAVRDGARTLIDLASYIENKELTDILLANLNEKAAENREQWAESYVATGFAEDAYIANVKKLLSEPTTWAEFSTQSTTFITEMNKVPEATCMDELLNQDETEIDCGGETCDACIVAEPEPEVVLETCEDEILNQDETEIDCGGETCDACIVAEPEPEVILPTCEDGILNQDETEIDCGGVCDACAVAETCTDEILNLDETEIDCGGSCDECIAAEPDSCEDGIKNQDETEIDCGGAVCDACVVAEPEPETPTEPEIVLPTCEDGIMNQDETAVDCGGTVCDACIVEEAAPAPVETSTETTPTETPVEETTPPAETPSE